MPADSLQSPKHLHTYKTIQNKKLTFVESQITFQEESTRVSDKSIIAFAGECGRKINDAFNLQSM